MEFRYKKTSSALDVKYEGEETQIFYKLFSVFLEKIKIDLKGFSHSELKGELEIKNDIPFGKGLGASAAFCVNVVRWLGHLGLLSEKKFFSFAKHIENIFHGESSGGDICVALEKKGIHFERHKTSWRHLAPLWKPHFYLSYSGKTSLTSYCVNHVKKWMKENPKLGKETDEEMRRSTEIAEKALMTKKSLKSLQRLKEAIEKANHCFQNWGLTEGAVDEEMIRVLKAGALAAKPTGAGGGGFVLSLWEKTPPTTLKHLIPCYSSLS